MELSFSGGKFVSNEGGLNFEEVLSDFPNAKIIRIMTYNISKNEKQDRLLEALQNTQADVQLITNIPSRMASYFDTESGIAMRNTARKNIRIYVSKLNPNRFNDRFLPLFHANNHAKIVGTENIVYIGSANYSNESANNIETGVIVEDKAFIQRLYSEFFDSIKEDSLSYFEDEFSAFSLFITSLKSKFMMHHQKLLSDLYSDNGHDGNTVTEAIFIDIDDLDNIRYDLFELNTVCAAADDTYEENNVELDALKESFSRLDIEWLISVVSEGGSLYELVSYDPEKAVSDILEEEFSAEAYDDNLEYYVNEARIEAIDQFEAKRDSFLLESDEFLAGIERILNALDEAIAFVRRNRAYHINPDVDNT